MRMSTTEAVEGEADSKIRIPFCTFTEFERTNQFARAFSRCKKVHSFAAYERSADRVRGIVSNLPPVLDEMHDMPSYEEVRASNEALVREAVSNGFADRSFMGVNWIVTERTDDASE